MNLNLTILKDYLPPELQTRLYGEAQDKLVCSRPFLCEADTSVITGNTYLLRAELLPFITPVSGCSFICVGSPVPFNWQESGISLLQINGSSSFTSVFNAICHIYDFLITGILCSIKNLKGRPIMKFRIYSGLAPNCSKTRLM